MGTPTVTPRQQAAAAFERTRKKFTAWPLKTYTGKPIEDPRAGHRTHLARLDALVLEICGEEAHDWLKSHSVPSDEPRDD